MTFWAKNPTGGAFKVQIKEEDEEAVDLLTTGLTGLADWTLKYAEIPATYNNKKVQLLFHATSNGGDANAYIFLDDVRVARGEAFEDVVTDDNSTRLKAIIGETIDFVMTRPMQFNGSYNTLCLPFDLSAEQLADEDCPLYNNTIKVFDYAHVDGAANELQLAIAGASSIVAGVPCFVKYDGEAGADRSVFLFKEVTIAVSEPLSKTDDPVTYQGIIDKFNMPAEVDEGTHKYIFVGGENQLYWPSEARTMKGFRAYFFVDSNDLTTTPIHKGMPARLVEHTNVTTEVESLQGNEGQVLKVLENNQVIIIRNGVKYNIQGQKIQ